MRIKIIILIEM